MQSVNLNSPLIAPKLIYMAFQLAILGLGVWKLAAMGLLPTAQSDWLAFEEPPKVSMTETVARYTLRTDCRCRHRLQNFLGTQIAFTCKYTTSAPTLSY